METEASDSQIKSAVMLRFSFSPRLRHSIERSKIFIPRLSRSRNFITNYNYKIVGILLDNRTEMETEEESLRSVGDHRGKQLNKLDLGFNGEFVKFERSLSILVCNRFIEKC